MLKRVIVIALLALPVAAWVFYKPIRVLAPQLAGVSCLDDRVCIDDASRNTEASKLYKEALQFVDSTVGEMEKKPRVIFCANELCYQSFGFGQSSANTIATFGIVISPRAWKPHYLRHEMIHHLQNERLGTLKALLRTPTWFKEGMAYSLSDDPRETLAEPFQQHRSQFDAWHRKVGTGRLWAEASNL